jgi:hypothetical protein
MTRLKNCFHEDFRPYLRQLRSVFGSHPGQTVIY